MYNVLIIGAGSIGALKPDKYDSPLTENILTHAHAVYNNDDLKLIGVVDKDLKKAKKAGDKWSCNYYGNINECKDKIDIVVCAVNTEYHKEVMKQIIQIDPRIVIAEKPLTNSYKDCQYIIDLYAGNGIPIAVNFPRRYIPEIQNLMVSLRKRKIQNINVQYVRGFQRDACHAIDLLNQFLGEYKDGWILNVEEILDNPDDATLTAHLIYDKCDNVIIQGCNGKHYSVFDIKIMVDNGLIEIKSHSSVVYFYGLKATEYGNFKSLDYGFDGFYTSMNKHLIYLYKNVVNHLKHKEKLICTGADALKVQKIYKEIGL